MENQFESDNQIEIDLKDLIIELLNNWKWIVLTMILVGGIAFSTSKFLMTPKYESTSELYVLSKSTSITSLADIQAGTSLTNDYMVVVVERPVIEQVIQNLALNETYKTMLDKITVENPTNSRILQITITDENPNRAKAIADEVARVAATFIAAKMDQDPPTIIHEGYADGVPVSPSVIKNTIIGVILGALVVIAIILISYVFNDTIMTPEDVEKKLGINILGTLPLEEAEDDGDERLRKKKNKKSKKTR